MQITPVSHYTAEWAGVSVYCALGQPGVNNSQALQRETRMGASEVRASKQRVMTRCFTDRHKHTHKSNHRHTHTHTHTHTHLI